MLQKEGEKVKWMASSTGEGCLGCGTDIFPVIGQENDMG